MSPLRPPKALILVTVGYIAMAVLIALTMNPNATFKLAADGTSWLQPAISLYEHGTLYIPAEPSLYLYRSPGVSLFFAGLMYLAGGVSATAIVIGQLSILYLAGLLFRSTVKDWFPGYEDLGLALILFNPNLVGMAYFAQSETLAAFTGMVVFFFLLKFAKGRTSWTMSVALGFSLGVSCWVRANLIYLVYVLPLILPLIVLAQKLPLSIKGSVARGVAATVAGLIAVAPLTLMLYQVEGQVGWSMLVSPRAEHDVLLDQFTHLEAEHYKITNVKALEKIKTDVQAPYIRSMGRDWDKYSENKKLSLLKAEYFRAMLGYPFKDWAIGYGLSFFQYFFGGGSGAWHNLFGVFANGQVRSVQRNSDDESAWFHSSRAGPSAMVGACSFGHVFRLCFHHEGYADHRRHRAGAQKNVGPSADLLGHHHLHGIVHDI